MSRFLFLLIIVMLLPFFTKAQTIITGHVKNKRGEALIVNVMVQSSNSSSISGFTTTNKDGNFTLTYKGVSDSLKIIATGINIGKHIKTIVNRNGVVNFITEEKAMELKEVNVIADKIKRTGDTLNYLVSAYIDQNDRVIGDILKKLPGVEVKSDGAISYNGKNINKFYVENLDLLQGRYGIATNNISAKDVASVQVLENHQPIKTLQDKIISDNAAINLKLKNNAKGTHSMTSLAGFGYKPWLWNAELISMYFAKNKQNMSAYKGNNSGDNVVSEFRSHYDYERIYIGTGSLLSVQMPNSPPVSQKRYLYNNSHVISTNQLFKVRENVELTFNVLYYKDRIQKEGYSLYKQHLPGDSILSIEESVRSASKINNIEIALRLNSNTKSYYLNNAFNLNASWNDDQGFGLSQSNTGMNDSILQQLNKPVFSIDNTLDIVKNVKDNSYKIHFSVGYGQKSHTLSVNPVDYFEDGKYSSLTQDVLSRDFISVLRLSYGFRYRYFNFDYDIWGRADILNMDTELNRERASSIILPPTDSLRNALWYNTYQTGINQCYSYKNGNFRSNVNIPLTYYYQTIDDHILINNHYYNRFIFNPSISFSYDLSREFTASSNASIRKSFGDMNSAYTGYIMHSYRSLQRNSIDRLFEQKSTDANFLINYRNAFQALFINTKVNYNKSWKNLLYGYNFQNIMSIKTIIDQPSNADGYNISLNASKGLDFWSSTLRVAGSYSKNKGELLTQNQVFDYYSQNYMGNIGFYINPISILSLDYMFSWGQNKGYISGHKKQSPYIKGSFQNFQANLFLTKDLILNLKAEYQYNNATTNRYTTFADASAKLKCKKIDLDLEFNNIFNSKQYISASYNNINTYYYSYNLRPRSILLKVRFKLK